ncbi:MAG: Transforming protein p29 precursor [Candidatus Heimdallarchaeota archaeon LC_2]|nr:MAG: Transforming protein p29 precursor [Candidatus Heimdallarchaeota archaeon LC_2]
MGDKQTSAKIVLIGENRVGKTSIRRQYSGLGFRTEHLMTIGTEFSQKEVILETQKIDIHIWDIASDLNYETLRRQKYLRKTNGAMIVFDLSRYETFFRLTYWLNELFEANPRSKIPILFVGNKTDLVRERAIPNEDALKFVEHIKNDKTMKTSWVGYIETSAKKGENIEESFNLLADAIFV